MIFLLLFVLLIVLLLFVANFLDNLLGLKEIERRIKKKIIPIDFLGIEINELKIIIKGTRGDYELWSEMQIKNISNRNIYGLKVKFTFESVTKTNLGEDSWDFGYSKESCLKSQYITEKAFFRKKNIKESSKILVNIFVAANYDENNILNNDYKFITNFQV